MEAPTALESILRRDRWIVFVSLVAASLLAWAWLVPAARDMYGAMDGPAAWMMAATWDAGYAFKIFLMWAVMMVGMMVPSAAPVILVFARVVRKAGPSHSPLLRTHLFLAGYLVAWVLFSVVATAGQALAAQLAWMDPMMEAASPYFGAAVLAVAGAWQLTAAKRACLTRCRNPMQFVADHWRPGHAGALRMGLEHGLYCVGCCWAIMALLFAGGVMNLTWIAVITLFVLLEKALPAGGRGGQVGGALLIVSSLVVLVRAAST